MASHVAHRFNERVKSALFTDPHPSGANTVATDTEVVERFSNLVTIHGFTTNAENLTDMWMLHEGGSEGNVLVINRIDP